MKIYINKIKAFRYPTKSVIKELVRAIVLAEKVAVAELSLTYVDNSYIQDINRQYLHKNRPTDVIAFTLSEPETPVIGDIYISVDQARLQACEYGVTAANELTRLTCHGVLHVLGYDHETPTEREQMTAKEDEWLAHFTNHIDTPQKAD